MVRRARFLRSFAALVLLLTAPARAARTNHLFLDESQMLPEGTFEFEQWVWAYGRIPNKVDRPASIWLWWSPVLAVSNHLELSLPIQMVDYQSDFYVHSIELVARYRIFPREQDDGWQPLIRVAYGQPLDAVAGPPSLETTFVLTIGSLQSIRTTLNVGVFMGLPFLQNTAQGTFSALGRAGVGLSFPVSKEFRLAGEVYGQLPIHGVTRPDTAQLYAGPSLAWTKGPFWITFGSLFGLTNNSSQYYPRVLWGVAL